MSKKKPKDNRETKKSDKYIIFITIIFMIVIVAAIAGNFFINNSSQLSYYGACLGAISTSLLGFSTLYLNHKIEKNNNDMQRWIGSLNETSLKLSYSKEYPYLDLNFIESKNEAKDTELYSLRDYNRKLNIKEYNIIENKNMGPLEFNLRLFNGEMDTAQNNLYVFDLINKSEVTISSIKILEVMWNINEKLTDSESDYDERYRFYRLIKKNEALHIEFRISANYESFLKTVNSDLYHIGFKFEICSLSGLKYEQTFYLEFYIGKIARVVYLPVEPKIPNKNDRT